MTPTYLIRRACGGLLSILLVSILTFALMQLAPGDAAESVAGEQATSQQVEIIRDRLGLDRPVLVQYFSWIGNALHGDLGESYYTGRSVTESIAEAIPATLSITVLALLLAAVVGVAAGAVAGMRKGTWIDRALSMGATLGIAMPSYWVGLLLVSVFALDLKLFPATSYAPLSDGPGRWIQHVALPALALGLATVAEVTRQTRGGVVDVLGRPYIRAARARGAKGGWLVRRHVLRNAAAPVVTVFGLQTAHLLGGVVVVEAVFGISGLGTLAINAVIRRDFPLIQGYVLLVAVAVVLINFIVDSCYGWINPKVQR